ncbi:MAG: exodeoxyribonuclease VII large subunit [Chloroflexota bacterium]|nr:exodeoxyribonuclease VII large subunit [Chloroflexota bacterium]
MQLLSVSTLNAYLAELFAYDPVLSDVWVEGEITNFSQSSKGHVYFTLKDGAAQMPCALFRSHLARVNAPLGNGQAVIAHGRVSLWQDTGKLQFYVDMVQPEGMGRLELEFQALKARLEEEGLFDPARKRGLPRFPATIGIVTSPQAAALQDMLNVLNRRYPLAEIVLSPTAVQGDGAGTQVAAAIESLHRRVRVDVIIVARGGGSMEELWAFNEEVVARAIFASPVPVISGVGHEVDYTIADYVADLRAPTPSAAAELVAPNIAELRSSLRGAREFLDARIREQVEAARMDVRHMEGHLQRLSPAHTLERLRERLLLLHDGVLTRLGHSVQLRRSRLEGQRKRLEALAPESVLRRGYAVVTTEDGRPVMSAAGVEVGEDLLTCFGNGTVRSLVMSVERKERRDVA